MSREEYNRAMRERRADLKARGWCVDCGKHPARRMPPGEVVKRPPTLCETCAEARRVRAKCGVMPPLLRQIQRVGGTL